MGRDDENLSWRGLFFGENSLDRARYVDFLRTQGNALVLTWSEFAFQVVIQRFRCSFQRFYKLPYDISCRVLQDLTKPIIGVAPTSFDDMIIGDMNTANALGAQANDSTLTGLLNTLNTAIKNVSTFAGAVKSTIQSVLLPLAAVQARVGILIASTNGLLTNVATIGGILPNNSVAKSVANLGNQTTNMQQLPVLRGLSDVLGRMSGNLNLINSPPNAKRVPVAGGNLFSIAQQKFGDATKWTSIAQANNMSDPVLSPGVQTITIPSEPSQSSGGVLNA